MERIVKFDPAFAKRYVEPGKNYGVHGVNMRMVVKGIYGAVQFLLFTNWHLPSVQEEFDGHEYGQLKHLKHIACHPQPADLGYHSVKPMYEGQLEYDCEYTETGKCYYDGSSLNAIRLYDKLVAEGDEAVWKELEDYYVSRFGALE